jgi:mannose/fructose/sorbose-specific phosphotransferase system IIA component
MIGIIVATHGDFGKQLISTLKMVLGDVEGIAPVSLVPEDSMESFEEKMLKALQEVDPKGTGSLVLVDMLGGTPFNVSARLLATHPLSIVTGANLPMLIKAASHHQETNLEGLALEVQKATRESIVTSVEILKR